MIKITKGKPPNADNHKEVHQPVVGEAEPRTANLEALAKSFAPVVTVRAVDDLKANPRNARTHTPQQVEQVGPACASSAGLHRSLSTRTAWCLPDMVAWKRPICPV